MSAGVRIGDVLKMCFPVQRPAGHEQTGVRPAVIVGIPDRFGTPRFPQLIAVPFTTNVGDYAESPLYPRVNAGSGGLTSYSVALTDHVRSLDISRILSRIGTLGEEELAPIRAALRGMFEF